MPFRPLFCRYLGRKPKNTWSYWRWTAYLCPGQSFPRAATITTTTTGTPSLWRLKSCILISTLDVVHMFGKCCIWLLQGCPGCSPWENWCVNLFNIIWFCPKNSSVSLTRIWLKPSFSALGSVRWVLSSIPVVNSLAITFFGVFFFIFLNYNFLGFFGFFYYQ